MPSPRRRRTWLWILVGLIAAMLFCCCAGVVWASTSGKSTVQRWGTEISNWATEQSTSGK
jgi:hypothetical protein